MQKTDAARVPFDERNGILAAEVDPVRIQLKADVRGVILDDVQKVFAVVLYKLDMMVVIIEIDALFLQLRRDLVCLFGKIHRLFIAAHAGHRQHANAQHIAIQRLAIVHDLLKIFRLAQILAGHAGHHRRDRGRAGRYVHAELVDGSAEAGNVLRRHRHLRDLDAVIADLREFLHGFKRVEFRHFCRGDGTHLNADQTFLSHNIVLLLF